MSTGMDGNYSSWLVKWFLFVRVMNNKDGLFSPLLIIPDLYYN